MTAGGPPLPAHLKRAAARYRLRRVMKQPRKALPLLVHALVPWGWEPDPALRRAILDTAVHRGDAAAARVRMGEPPGAVGSAAARRRADAFGVLAAALPATEARRARAVAEFLRQPRPPRETAGRGPAGAAAEAVEAASRLSALGHERPRCVVTLPALEGNPYSAMMEQAYAAAGLYSVHVDTLEDAAAVLDARAVGGYDAVLHVNASNRLVWGAKDAAAADAAATEALARIDAWRAAGVPLVVTVHDGPILDAVHGAAEQRLAQGIADRADRIHVLTATTPDALHGWIRLDPGRVVHLPHPSYDGIYPDPPSRAEARDALGLDAADPVDGGTEVVLGLVGILSERKGARHLFDALAATPDPLPDGRRLRLVIAGRVVDPGGEDLIQAAYADSRVIPLFGTVPDERMPWLLAALDVAVVPYERYLNSGWTVLALTAGIPVLAPAGGTATEVVRPGALRTFDPADPADLARALIEIPSLVTRTARAEARASVADLHAQDISARFAALIRSLSVGG